MDRSQRRQVLLRLGVIMCSLLRAESQWVGRSQSTVSKFNEME